MAPRHPAADTDIHFRALFDQAPISMQRLSADGRTLAVNRAWEILWGTDDAPELKAYVLSDYNMLADPQLEAKGILAPLRRAFAGESSLLPTICYDPAEIGKPGRARWLRASAHPVKDGDGKVIEVLLLHDDVTEHVEAQDALRATAQQELRTAEERLRVATEAGNIGIWEWDIANGRLIWSERVYRLHGVDPETFQPGLDNYAALIHPDDLAHHWQRVETALKDKTGYSSEFRALMPDGTTRWLSTWAKVETDAQGEAARLIGATISIDDHKRAESALKESAQRKDEFLAMLAHELRNPLAPISVSAEILRLPGIDDSRRRQASEVISRQVGHMTKLIDDLMDVSRVTRGLVQLHRESLDLKSVVGHAIEQVRPLIESRQHALDTHMDAGHFRVDADRTRLVQILSNLLNNAAKYTPAGGEISLDVRRVGAAVRISVSDNGQGIEPDLLPCVFDLFTQGPRTLDRSQGGLGIGLALVKSIVRLHGGEVEAHSSGLGLGSVFTVTLPLAEDGPAPVSTGAQSQERAAPAQTILVVDDNIDAARSLAMLLETLGHRVAVAENARRALEKADEATPDIYILDIGLPDMTGYELVGRLKQQKAGTFVALTGYGQTHDREEALRAGFDHHFVKPVDIQAIVAVLNAAAP